MQIKQNQKKKKRQILVLEKKFVDCRYRHKDSEIYCLLQWANYLSIRFHINRMFSFTALWLKIGSLHQQHILMQVSCAIDHYSLNHLSRGWLGESLFIYLIICCSSRVGVFMICYHSIASCTSNCDISASAICHLWRFI